MTARVGAVAAESVRVAVGALTALTGRSHEESQALHKSYVAGIRDELGTEQADYLLGLGLSNVAVLLIVKLGDLGFDAHDALAEIAREWGVSR